MSVVQKAFDQEGISLADGYPPLNQRGAKCWRRAINALRAAEAETNDRLAEAERQLNEALQQNLALHEYIRKLEAGYLKHRLQTGLGEMKALTAADRGKILGWAEHDGGPDVPDGGRDRKGKEDGR